MGNLPELFDLSGRVAIVTGGAGLLGEEFCKTLAEAGASVVITDIDGAAAENVAASLNNPITDQKNKSQELTSKAFAIQADVSVKESVDNLIESTKAEFGRVDILVNSAAMDPKFDRQGDEDSDEMRNPLSVEFEDYPLETWNQALDVNLTGLFLCCQAAGRQMRAQGRGVIINVCSIYGLVGPDQRIYKKDGEPPQFKPVYYSVTKAGVLGLTSYLATYYAGKNIRVNALTPGGVYNEHDVEFLKAYSSRTVLGRMAEKDEMNGALLFLASDASSYMTGGNLVVDGGWTAW
ncbi:MAG: SDR family oxidoreductase [Chloroflexota bacterium]|nr:MAG: SDR family oxidoreductase [Chloroflexota bacterium]